MATKILVESFYSNTIQSAMDTSSTEVTVDVAPTNDIGYVILENGESNQEMAKYQAKAGLVLSSMLRGLSLTALTDTEVAGNKKTHTVNSSIEQTDVHYLLNDKVSNSAEETITGQKTFSAAPIFTLGATSGAAAASATELIRYGEAVKNTGNETIAGIKTFSTIPWGPNGDPITDNQLTRKKYVDDQIATLSVPAFIDSHAVYTPAYMTGGASAETTIALWDSVSNGSFRVTIDGTAYNVDGIDFTATHVDGIVTDMNGVAARIQTYIRAATGSTETCVWSTDHIVITSVNTTVTSQVSVLSTSSGTVGTDISGAGAGTWLDSETGRGTATAAVLDPTADVGKVVKLDAAGLFDDGFMPTNLQGIAATGTTDVTGTELETLTDGSDASALHTHGVSSQAGTGTYTGTGASGNIDIDLAPFASAGKHMVRYVVKIASYAYNNPNYDANHVVFDRTCMVGEGFSGVVISSTENLAGSPTYPTDAVSTPQGGDSQTNMGLTVSGSAGNSITTTIVPPVWSGTNLRFAYTNTVAGSAHTTITIAVMAIKLG